MLAYFGSRVQGLFYGKHGVMPPKFGFASKLPLTFYTLGLYNMTYTTGIVAQQVV